MKARMREHPEVLAKLIYETIREYAATQEYGVCMDQINESLNLVQEEVNFEKIDFEKEA
jgi:hypothetical protein